MEIEDTSSHVSIGFPLGLALLVTLMLIICCFFCCCLHWEKLQSLLSSYGVINPQAHIQPDLASSHQKSAFPVVVITPESIFFLFQKEVKEKFTLVKLLLLFLLLWSSSSSFKSLIFKIY